MKDYEVNDGLMDEYSSEMLQPEKVRERLKAQGILITQEQAVQIVELLDHLSNIIITQYLRQCK
jgi:hypothetical protein